MNQIEQPLNHRFGGKNAAYLAEVHFSPGEACRNRIIECLKNSRRTIDICVYTITDNQIRFEIEVALKRGCQIRIVTDDEKIGDIGSDIRHLATLAIPIKHDAKKSHMHHKFAVFDQQVLLTGSFNWTRSASRKNQENLIVSSNPRLVQPFLEEFERLWKKFPEFKVFE